LLESGQKNCGTGAVLTEPAEVRGKGISNSAYKGKREQNEKKVRAKGAKPGTIACRSLSAGSKGD